MRLFGWDKALKSGIICRKASQFYINWMLKSIKKGLIDSQRKLIWVQEKLILGSVKVLEKLITCLTEIQSDKCFN